MLSSLVASGLLGSGFGCCPVNWHCREGERGQNDAVRRHPRECLKRKIHINFECGFSKFGVIAASCPCGSSRWLLQRSEGCSTNPLPSLRSVGRGQPFCPRIGKRSLSVGAGVPNRVVCTRWLDRGFGTWCRKGLYGASKILVSSWKLEEAAGFRGWQVLVEIDI